MHGMSEPHAVQRVLHPAGAQRLGCRVPDRSGDAVQTSRPRDPATGVCLLTRWMGIRRGTTSRGSAIGREHTMPAENRGRLLAIYLNDHLAGATAGVELMRRVSKSHRNAPRAAELSRIVTEIE